MSGIPDTQRQRHDEVLAEIARVAGSSLELTEVLERIVECAAALTGADRSSIWLLDRAERRLAPSALFGMDHEFTEGWKRRPLEVADEPLSREVLATGEPVVVNDATTDPRTDKESVQFFGDRSLMVVPLVRRGRVLGTLFVNHVAEPYTFTEEDVATVTVIANQAAIAIDNARLFGDSRRLANQLHRSFRHAGEALAAGVDVHRNLDQMLQLAADTAGADGGALQLLEEGGRGTYAVAQTGRPLTQPMYHERFAVLGAAGALGTLELWREAPEFDREERELLAAFADHIRSAIEHARLYVSLQEEQERARLAEKTQGEFSSMISHELRTPMALIRGYVATLLRPPVPLAPERARRYVEGIDAAADRLQRLIDNLLSANRLESQLFAGAPRPIEVRAVIQQTLAAARVLSAGREVVVDLPEEEVWLLGDLDQLMQVFENLISNAMKYAPGDSPARLAARRHGDKVRVSVQDSGPGIPEESLKRVFEKFYRVTPSAGDDRQGPKGLGLGLYICRKIIEAHGGTIWAENVPEGGSVFQVELPASARTAAAIHSIGDPHENHTPASA